MKFLTTTITVFIALSLFSCKENTICKEAMTNETFHHANQVLIKVSMEDIFSPPVASRVFAYPNLVAYEVYQHKYKNSVLNTIAAGTISGIITDTTKIDYSIAAAFAYSTIARTLVFSEKYIDTLEMDYAKQITKSTISNARIEASKKYGLSVADQMKKWIKADNYAKVKAGDQYTLAKKDSSWMLTPPTFDQALEPNWMYMRPIFIKNLEEFNPKPRPPFSQEKNSAFYKAAMEVLEISKKVGEPEERIALHWDDNPNQYTSQGHNTFFLHKISPPPHWINITKIIAKNNDADINTTLKAYCAVSTSMFDAIISCWKVKFTDQLIRPITYIHRNIDKDFKPFIQTPPFPEYTSGHSCVSGSASLVLSKIFNKTSFMDDTETRWQLPVRSYNDVRQAGQEASVSRIYGGIHYRFGIENGFDQGTKIGEFILTHIK